MNLISFSLWGSNAKYLVGAIRNAELAQTIYPGWQLRFYIDLLVPNSIIMNLEKFSNVEIVSTNVLGSWESLFFRHFPASEAFEHVLFRDTDSRLNLREKSAVDQWMSSNKKVLILKDHPYHRCAFSMPGLLGFKRGTAPNIIQDIKNFNQQDQYGTDYIFFDNWLKKNVDKSDIMRYDEFNGGLSYPYKRVGYEFVGEVFDENQQPNFEHREILKKALQK